MRAISENCFYLIYLFFMLCVAVTLVARVTSYNSDRTLPMVGSRQAKRHRRCQGKFDQVACVFLCFPILNHERDSRVVSKTLRSETKPSVRETQLTAIETTRTEKPESDTSPACIHYYQSAPTTSVTR